MISLFPRAFQGFINLGAKMLVYLVENERSKFELLTTQNGLMLVVEKFKFIFTGFYLHLVAPSFYPCYNALNMTKEPYYTRQERIELRIRICAHWLCLIGGIIGIAIAGLGVVIAASSITSGNAISIRQYSGGVLLGFALLPIGLLFAWLAKKGWGNTHY